ncbi:uncharacterized protein [Epargyreus clarus]|uniref:uncharacterized protein n=1 Tax=Epargyreus clarus TaxID=520877 RepID=UPI003C300279
MKLASSASDQNAYFTYVCLINDIKSNIAGTNDQKHTEHSLHIVDLEDDLDQDQLIQVERSKALHELVESHKKDESLFKEKETDPLIPYPTQGCSEDQRIRSQSEYVETNPDYVNPNLLKLTKMKWLTEDRDESSDSSYPSISPSPSNTSSVCSGESDEIMNRRVSSGDRCLSTILRMDREHNMFGLSNIAIVGTKPSRKLRKDDDRPVFHQTAIVQICCSKRCCRHKSNTDLPTSLKCGGCRGCCFDASCPTCSGGCGSPCDDPPCPTLCSTCPKGKCCCKLLPCPPSKCLLECANSCGLKISVNRKPKYEPTPIELTPRSSCVLQKPVAARSCHHTPICIPPSSCFPYLMPCYWPSRPSAPCSTPARCFHNPPCLPARTRRTYISCKEQCPPGGKCVDESKNTKCNNQMCIGNNPELKKEIESRYGEKN